MNQKTIRAIGAGTLIALWLALALWAWLSPSEAFSDSERRGLAQMPALSGQALSSGSFMEDFESYTLDQFPLRNTFRQLKSVFHYYVLGQKDNNGIYLAQGHAAKLEYPLNQSSLNYAASRFSHIYETYLEDSGSDIYFCVVPDKGYYLADANGYPAMDYDALSASLEEALPWADFIDITAALDAQDYYRTDTHWRQERLLPAAAALCQAMGAAQPNGAAFTQSALDRPFYGVYYGQAALPMEAETMYIMKSDLLEACTVHNFETGKDTQVYDMDKLTSRDLYDVFLSGAVSLMTIENPHATTDRELILFRDSFGSAMAPLLMEGYKTITLVDIRYVSPEILEQFIQFNGQDVLFLYSTTVLNNSSSLK